MKIILIVLLLFNLQFANCEESIFGKHKNDIDKQLGDPILKFDRSERIMYLYGDEHNTCAIYDGNLICIVEIYELSSELELSTIEMLNNEFICKDNIWYGVIYYKRATIHLECNDYICTDYIKEF